MLLPLSFLKTKTYYRFAYEEQKRNFFENFDKKFLFLNKSEKNASVGVHDTLIKKIKQGKWWKFLRNIDNKNHQIIIFPKGVDGKWEFPPKFSLKPISHANDAHWRQCGVNFTVFLKSIRVEGRKGGCCEKNIFMKFWIPKNF